MKKNLFASTFLFFILTAFEVCGDASARALTKEEAQKKCDAYQNQAEINFLSSYGKLKYDTSLSTQQLSALSKKHKAIDDGDKASGLSLSDVVLRVSMRSKTYNLDSVYSCVIPTQIDVFVGYQNPVIYISRDVLRDECYYQIVVRHEQTHQQINVLALEYFLPQFKALAKKYAKDMNPTLVQRGVSTPQQVINAKNKEFSDNMSDLVNQFKKFIADEQKNLDNDKNYAFENKICGR